MQTSYMRYLLDDTHYCCETRGIDLCTTCYLLHNRKKKKKKNKAVCYKTENITCYQYKVTDLIKLDVTKW